MNRFHSVVASLILMSSLIAPLPVSAETSVAQSTLQLLFPQYLPGDNLAVDPGETIGSFLIAYFARQDHTMYDTQTARRLAISLGLIAPETSVAMQVNSDILRQLSYRHRILYNDDPVANKHGDVGDIKRHITRENYSDISVIEGHISYYERRLEDITLPPRLAETLYFRKIRFDALEQQYFLNKIPVKTANGVQLEVPFFRQQRTLSCEMASLRSVLGYYGHDVAEDTLITQLGVSFPLQFANGIWGDPQEAFVGNIHGAQSNYSGYGTYWKPVARVGQRYVPQLQWFEKGSLQTLTGSIDAGHPVIIWSVVPAKGGFFTLQWTTPDGKEITGYNGEHSWVVDGYTGTAENPTSFHVVDPYFGIRTVSAAELTRQWERFDMSGVAFTQ